MKRGFKLRITAIVLMLVVGFGAIYGGWLLMVDPSGQKLNIPLILLEKTFFDDYLIPGIVLFVVIGLLNLLVAILAILKTKHYAWLILIQGGLLICWLSIELLFNKYFFTPILHYPLYAIGILLLTIGYVERKHSTLQN